jgi:hypothetical protein
MFTGADCGVTDMTCGCRKHKQSSIYALLERTAAAAAAAAAALAVAAAGNGAGGRATPLAVPNSPQHRRAETRYRTRCPRSLPSVSGKRSAASTNSVAHLSGTVSTKVSADVQTPGKHTGTRPPRSAVQAEQRLARVCARARTSCSVTKSTHCVMWSSRDVSDANAPCNRGSAG